MEKISIVVPVYNVEDSLRQCLNSLIKQTYENIEIILIDDGSTDFSGEICNQYAEEHNKVTVIHKTNGGLASARNEGLKYVTGKYVMFLDSDDYVDPKWCEHMVCCTKEKEDNYIFGGIVREYKLTGKRVNNEPYSEKKENIKIEDFIRLQLHSDVGYAWNALYYHRIIKENSITFPENRIVEDLSFNLKYLMSMNFLTYSGYSDNHYIIDDRDTLSRKYTKDSFRRWREKYQDTMVFIDNKLAGDSSLKKQVADAYLYPFLHVLDNTFDVRNSDSIIDKLSYNNKVVNSTEFQECLKLADSSKENNLLIGCLKKKKYWLYQCIQTVSHLK